MFSEAQTLLVPISLQDDIDRQVRELLEMDLKWKVLPYEMKNAGIKFQKSMDKALAPHKKHCRSYIDDVAIFSETRTEHLQHLKKVFETLREIGLTVNLEKCEFGKKTK